MDIDRSTPAADEPSPDEQSEAIFAADDTGMLAGERIITIAETNSGSQDEGNV